MNAIMVKCSHKGHSKCVSVRVKSDHPPDYINSSSTIYDACFSFWWGSDLLILIWYSFHREYFCAKIQSRLSYVNFHSKRVVAGGRRRMTAQKNGSTQMKIIIFDINRRLLVHSPVRSFRLTIEFPQIWTLQSCQNASLLCPCLCGKPRTNYSLWSNVAATCMCRWMCNGECVQACTKHM